MRYLLFFIIFLSSSVQAKVLTTLISEDQNPEVQQLIRDAEEALPIKVREALSPEPIKIRFVSFSDQNQVLRDPCDPKDLNPPQAYGWADHKNREIHVNELLLPVITNPWAYDRPLTCGHKSFLKLAKATLIHEVIHFYDRLNLMTPMEKRKRSRCAMAKSSNKNRITKTSGVSRRECFELLRRKFTVSGQARFLNIAGWTKQGLIFKKRKQANWEAPRTPDPYELSSPKESLAVNMEYFLLDETYACRRPLFHELLSEHFELDPFPNRNCEMNREIPVVAGRRSFVANLDPSRIYSIDFLFASKGPQMMSRWGHSMYRVVVCDPRREEVGPKCRHDLDHHLVISFLADVNTISINPLRGLKGDYPSRVFVYPFLKILNDYTNGELRDLISLPINLTHEEKVRFINHTVVQFWEYSGRYFFLSNNCATEALNFLKTILDQNDPFQRKGALTPRSLYKNLTKTGKIDRSILENPAEAKKRGHLFESKGHQLEQAFEAVRDWVPGKNYKKFIKESSAEVRRAGYDAFIQSNGGKRDRKTAIYFFTLESYILRNLEKAVLSNLARVLTGKEQKTPEEQEVFAWIQEAKRLESRIKAPWNHTEQGYGVPLEGDFQTVSVEASQEVKEQYRQVLDDITSWIAEYRRSELLEEKDKSLENRKFFYIEKLKARKEELE